MNVRADLDSPPSANEEEEVKILTSPNARTFSLWDRIQEWQQLADRAITVAASNAFKLWDEPSASSLPLYKTHILVFTLQCDPLHRDLSTSVVAHTIQLVSHKNLAITAPPEMQARLSWRPSLMPGRVSLPIIFRTSTKDNSRVPQADSMTNTLHSEVSVERDGLSWAEVREEGRNPRLQKQRGTEKWWAAMKHINWELEFQRRIAVSALVEEGEKISPRVKMCLEEGVYSKSYTEVILAELNM